jgi:AcrR family transcriptional regulator
MQETRERILQKSHDLFNRYGIRSITMDEIAAQLGISKKTIYQYFADKNELVDAVTQNHLTQNKCKCEAGRKVADSAVHEIFLTMDMVQDMMANMNPAIFYDLQKYHPATFAKLTEHRNTFLFKQVKDNLEWGIQDQLYRAEINVDVMTKVRLETMFLPFNQDVFPHSKYRLAEVEIEILENYLYGIATLKGHKLIEKYKQQRIKQTVK